MSRIPSSELRALAPEHLPNFRKRRYLGDDLCLPIAAFTESDQHRLRDIYDYLEDLFAWTKDNEHAPAEAISVAEGDGLLAPHTVRRIADEVRGFGPESMAANGTELMAKTAHDVRGGALSALVGWLQLAQLRPPDHVGRRRLFLLARDHLKIMRNALLGLDDAKREADLSPQFHGTDLIVEKWRLGLLAAASDGHAPLRIDCDYDGQIAECCVEFGALDRVLYNLINNASRHIAGEEIELFIQAAEEGGEVVENLRFVVANRVGDEDAQKLAGRDLQTLFEPGISSTGSGFGLTVVADFVSNAFGIARQQALEGRYLGAKLWEGRFLAWFHWPIAADV